MTEREKFEMWASVEDFSIRQSSNRGYDSLPTRSAWEAWKAALSTRKQYGFGIVDKDGKPHISDVGAFHGDELNRMVELLNDEFPASAPYQVIELFYEDKE